MMSIKCIPDEEDGENDELLWVKAGEPGEKPTIIRQIRSESSSSSSRDNSGGSTCNRKNLLTVENGTVYRTSEASSDSMNSIDKRGHPSNSESQVIVVNISEQIYPVNVDKQRIQRWRDLHSPNVNKKLPLSKTLSETGKKSNEQKVNDVKRPLSQPERPLSNCSPGIERCASSASPFNRMKLIKCRDEGYTSLSEDCKDSDNESVRSRSLPSSWRPSYLNRQRQEKDLYRYAQKMSSNAGVQDIVLEDESKSMLNSNDKKRKGSKRYKVEHAIEICTCFICLRSAFYHAEEEDDTDSLVDHPCSCEKPNKKCCGRWAIIGALVCLLPFLLCYPPFKCCLSLHDSRTKKKRKKKEKRRRQKDIELRQTPS